MIKALESDTRRKLIVMPRGTFKSSIGVVGYSIWKLLNNPDLRIMIDSEVYTNSKNFIREIRAHISTTQMNEYFPGGIGPQWGEGEITVGWRQKNLREPSVRAAGTNITVVSQHFDVIICDDLNSDNNSRTPESRKKIIDHYKMLTSILEPDGTIIVIGTRYASDDVIGYILENEAK